MVWKIELNNTAQRQFDKLDPQTAKRISAFLDERLSTLDNPRLLGAPLQGAKFGEF